MTTQKDQIKKKSARDLKKLRMLSENSAEGLGNRREHCWGYVCIYENTPEKLPQLYLVVQGRALLEHSRHIVKVDVEATC